MTITKIELEKFTAFGELSFAPSSGINVLIGANGMGKTHLMKVAYAACDVSKTGQDFAEKLVTCFLPSRRSLGRLVQRQGKSAASHVAVSTSNSRLSLSFSSHAQEWKHPHVVTTGDQTWRAQPIESVFVPVKEMLANAPGFRSLYNRREIHFESIYADIVDRAFLPVLRGPKDSARKRLLNLLQAAMDGKVASKGEEFFLKNKHGDLEFTLLAEGLRKLGLLWLLIQNGTLTKGAVFFWDEPETNLNPRLFSTVIEILLELQRLGVQVFVTTHDYAIIKELELATRPGDRVCFHALHRPTGSNSVQIETQTEPFLLKNSPIADAMTSLYDREIRKSLGGGA